MEMKNEVKGSENVSSQICKEPSPEEYGDEEVKSEMKR